MYKFSDKQISFTDFNMPNGMELNPENRWVKKAQTIPWDEIELKYAQLFSDECGAPAKPLRLALGALLIYTEYASFSDEETVFMIQEHPYMQYFCGFPGYVDERPFDPSLMVYFRKRLTPEILGEINEIIICANTPENDNSDDDNNNSDNSKPIKNKGDLIADSTCAPQNIKFPTDINLLNEARENLEEMIDELHDVRDGVKPRTYRKNARRDYLNCIRKKNKSGKQIRKAIKKQLNYIYRDYYIILSYFEMGRTLSDKHFERFNTIRDLYDQQVFMYNNSTHQVDDRIVSLSQPWVRPIVRGKAKAKVEFGAKIDISVADGFTRLEHSSFDSYNESGNLIDIIERYKKRTGYYPERVLVDQIYRNKTNIKFCKKHGIQILGKPLGRPPKNAVIDKKGARQSEIDRIEVERKFAQAKASHGLGLIRMKLKETTKTAIALSIVALNIAHIRRVLGVVFRWFGVRYKLVFIQ